MSNSSKNNVILVRYPFSDLSNAKVRPAIIVSTKHISQDIFIVPLTSKANSLQSGEFVLVNWQAAGLNVPTAVKRCIYTVEKTLIIKPIGQLQQPDVVNLDRSLQTWLG